MQVLMRTCLSLLLKALRKINIKCRYSSMMEKDFFCIHHFLSNTLCEGASAICCLWCWREPRSWSGGLQSPTRRNTPLHVTDFSSQHPLKINTSIYITFKTINNLYYLHTYFQCQYFNYLTPTKQPPLYSRNIANTA